MAYKRKPNNVGKKDRLELAKARARNAGLPEQSGLNREGQIETLSKEELRKREIQETAQKSIDIEKAKKELEEKEIINKVATENIPATKPEGIMSFVKQEGDKKGYFERRKEAIQEHGKPNLSDVIPALGGTQVGQVDPVGLGLAAGGIAAGGATFKATGGTQIAQTAAELGDEALEGLLKGTKLTLKLKKANPAKFAIERELLVNKISFRSGLTSNQARVAVNTYLKYTQSDITKILTSSALKKYTAGIATGSGLFSWLASDNILSGTSFFANNVQRNLNEGLITKDDAIQRLDTLQKYRDVAKQFINTNTRINPLLWPFRKIILTNEKATQENIDLLRMSIENS